MADLNKEMINIQEHFLKIKEELKRLLLGYDELYREINWNYINERKASTSSEGFEDFYKLLLTIRRNKDLIGSLVRGCEGIKTIDKFKFIEEEIPLVEAKKSSKIIRKKDKVDKKLRTDGAVITVEAESVEMVSDKE
jgi:hypothetical protein